MESNFFQFSEPIIIDWLYIVTVVLGSDVLMRITMATKLKKHSVYTVLAFALIVGIVFWVLNGTVEDTGLAVKNLLVNYCIATSLYELIIKKIKSLLQNDNSKQQRIESDTI